ncbi:MAG: TrbG/VirB9 family P-type conjugative transfer protein [Proteobacteria bacterium]|nr:TrbG/VirB9 family P-type conjugative transfer protein [Pseudomonadota bacterium]
MNHGFKIISISFLIMSTQVGCSTYETSSQKFVPLKQTIERSKIIEIKEKEPNYRLMLGNDPALTKAFHQYVKTGKANNIVTDGAIQFAFSQSDQPIIKTVPFQETVISLKPGERFTNISSGDPSRWSYAVAKSGRGNKEQQHILIKPSEPNISTNMVITTDERIYTVLLVSLKEGNSAKHVSFWYPDELVARINERSMKEGEGSTSLETPAIDVNHLNFNYKISSGLFNRKLSWEPSRVFDDGAHTYIEFSRNRSNRDLPAIFVLEDKKLALLNYRYKPPYYVVDKIFKKAVLVMGVGNNQAKVDIVNQSYHE